MFNIYRIAAASCRLHSADLDFNVEQMSAAYMEMTGKGASLTLFPAFAVTGKSCGVLFKQKFFLDAAKNAAEKFAASTGNVPAVFGVPELVNGKLTECAAIARNGKIIAHVLRRTPDLPDFSGNLLLPENYFFSGQVFDAQLRFSVEFDGDIPQINAADIQLFCGAKAEIPGAWAKRRQRFAAISEISGGAVAAAFTGCGESTTDQVYGGALLICENGSVLSERPSPAAEEGIVYADIDLEKICFRQLNKTFSANTAEKLSPLPETQDLRFLNNPPNPFLPSDQNELKRFCRETFALQTAGLYQRFCRCHAEKLVIGISGGLDSTLALAVLAKLCQENNLPMTTILAITMPGFGTTGRTKNNAVELAKLIGTEIREIPIVPACMQHFSDIGHDAEKTNCVYENSQARERTQILMDIANAVNGIVIGTGDLSEIALGWSTFNGDQMAMYAVNASIPKSNIAAMLQYAVNFIPGSENILLDVINTPVSPELLPLDEHGEIIQKTENILGAYELHDFYLYHFTHGVSNPEKLLVLAKHAFEQRYPDEELLRVQNLFIKRFFSQQFKRTAAPDGVQAGIISLSARSAWQMPADLNGNLWK